MNKRRTIWTAVFLATVLVLCVAGTKISRLTQTTNFQGDSLFLVVTGSQSAGTLETRSIEASNMLSVLTNFPGWPAGGSGGSATNAISTLKVNGTNVSTAATSLNLIAGTNVTVNATNAAGVVDVRINSSGGDLASYVLTNNQSTSVNLLNNLHISGRLTGPNGLWTNVVYVNATNSSPTINGQNLTNSSVRMPIGSLLIVGPGNYFIPTNGVSLLPAIASMYCMPGARISSGDSGDVIVRFFIDDVLSGIPITNNILGYGEFFMTNNSGTEAVLYIQDANSKVTFQCKSASLSGLNHTIWCDAGELNYEAMDFTRSDAANAFNCGGLTAKVWIKSDKVYSAGPLIASHSVQKLGDSIWNVRYAETIASANTEPRAITLGTNVVMELGVVKFGRTGNTITSQFATNEVAGGIPGLLKNTTVYALSTSTNGILTKAIGSPGWFGTALTLQNCVLYGPTSVDPILAETSVGGLLTLENCTIYEGSSATNWIRGAGNAGSEARVKVSNLRLNRQLPSHANVTVFTNYIVSPTTVIGKFGVTDTLQSKFIYPSNSTVSRVWMIGADGIATNVPSGSAGEFLKYDGTSAAPAGGSGGTNYPPVILGNFTTNITIGVGVRQHVTFNTNASFGINFTGTALNGETVRVGVSNRSGSTIYWTNYQGGTITAAFDPAVGSNVSAFAVPATSIGTWEFVFHTNYQANGSVRQEVQWHSGAEFELQAGATTYLRTNGLAVTVDVKTNQTLTSASIGVLTNNTFKGDSIQITGTFSQDTGFTADLGITTAASLTVTAISQMKSSNFVGTLVLPNVATNNLLMTGGGSNVVAATVGSGLSFSGGALSSSANQTYTNSFWVDAGAMKATGGSTGEGGRNGATTGSWTNSISAYDTWDFDDTTNESVQCKFSLGPTFSGLVGVDIHFASTNTAILGSSNIVWQVAIQANNTNGAFGSWTYFTNQTQRIYTSNMLQIATMPLITVGSFNPRSLLDLRISRLGTNTSDVLVGDARLLGAQVSFTSTNIYGGPF